MALKRLSLPTTFKLYASFMLTADLAFFVHLQITGEGAVLKRSVPDDNSCLFHSLVYASFFELVSIH
jgi:hypothetical protein